MNPIDPRDPKNVIAYMLFFGDEAKPRGTPQSAGTALAGAFALLAALLLIVAAAMR